MRPGLEDDADDALISIGGVDGDQHLRRLLSQLCKQFRALEMRHPVVDERQVRMALPHAGDRGDTVSRLTDDLEALALEEV